MTDPGQVSVNVAALRVIHEWWYGVEDTPDDTPIRLAFFHLFDAIPEPEPEWEPTDDQEARMLRVWPGLGTLAVRRHLQALHREGLIP